MTREEAKMILEEVKIMDDSMYQYNTKYLEALEMAIQALKQEPVCIAKVEFDEDKLREIVKEQISLIAIQEPCEDAISRQEVLNQIFYSTDNSGDVVLGSVLRRRIENLPSVRPQEPTTHGYMLVCPNCGLDVHSDFKTCPRCGAKMESEGK